MKTFLTVLFILAASVAQAQETVANQPKKVQQLDLGFGIGGSATNAKNMANTGLNTYITLTGTFRENLMARCGMLNATFIDKQPASRKWDEDNHKVDMIPFHTINSFYLAAGKRIVIENSIQFIFFSGLSFSSYKEPINVTQITADFGWFGSYQVLDHSIEIHKKPGLLLQAEVMILPFRAFGFTLGTYYHFVPETSNGGFNLSLNLGRVRTRENKIL